MVKKIGLIIGNYIHIATTMEKIKELLPSFNLMIKRDNSTLKTFPVVAGLCEQLNATADNSPRRHGRIYK